MSVKDELEYYKKLRITINHTTGVIKALEEILTSLPIEKLEDRVAEGWKLSDGSIKEGYIQQLVRVK